MFPEDVFMNEWYIVSRIYRKEASHGHGKTAAPPPIPEPVRVVRDAQADSAVEAQLPFAGYDRLNADQVKDGLSDHSQIELEAVESYERMFANRPRVLDEVARLHRERRATQPASLRRARCRRRPVADRLGRGRPRDLEFTYSLIDRIFRLSLGELADFSGAKYDGDFSLSLEEAQRRKHEYVAEQIGIAPGRRCSTWAAAGARCSPSSARRGAAGSASPCPPRRRRPADATVSTPTSATRGRSPATASGRFDAVASLGAFEHFCSPEEHRAGRQDEIYRDLFAPDRERAARAAAGSTSRRWCSAAT